MSDAIPGAGLPINATSSMLMESITTSAAPAPGGHYSQAIRANGFVFVSGQLPFDTAKPPAVPDGIEAQTRQALANVEQILLAAGSSLGKVVSVNAFITEIGNWPRVNAVYAEVFGEHKPTRAIAVSPDLHHGCLIEFQAVALA
jgi:2-iminobutanoate/2-iminopropanoate deaminase